MKCLRVVDKVANKRCGQLSENREAVTKGYVGLLPELSVVRQTSSRVLLGSMNERWELGTIADGEDRLHYCLAYVTVNACPKYVMHCY